MFKFAIRASAEATLRETIAFTSRDEATLDRMALTLGLFIRPVLKDMEEVLERYEGRKASEIGELINLIPHSLKAEEASQLSVQLKHASNHARTSLGDNYSYHANNFMSEVFRLIYIVSPVEQAITKLKLGQRDKNFELLCRFLDFIEGVAKLRPNYFEKDEALDTAKRALGPLYRE